MGQQEKLSSQLRRGRGGIPCRMILRPAAGIIPILYLCFLALFASPSSGVLFLLAGVCCVTLFIYGSMHGQSRSWKDGAHGGGGKKTMGRNEAEVVYSAV